MKDIFDTLIQVMLDLIIWGSVIYFIIVGIAWSASAAELTHDEKVVALTILGEARGEGNAGMYAVACVIQERSIKRKQTLVRVCLAKKQFSCWNGKTIGQLQHLLKSPSAPYAIMLAKAMCKGSKLVRTYTGNADHYYSTKYLKKPPYWARGKTATKRIGNHVFYKLK